MQPQFDSGLSLERENVMKEKKVGDKIVFNYEVYDVVNNVEYEYDHTDTLVGVVEEVVPSDRGGYTKYKVKVTELLNVERKKDYDYYLNSDEHTLEVSDDKVYRGSGLHDVIYNGMCPKPTVCQIERIIKMYDPNKDITANMHEISRNWYKYGLEAVGAYDEEEFGIVKPTPLEENTDPLKGMETFWRGFKKEVMAGINDSDI